MTNQMRPLSIAIAAMGGQGGGVLAEWLVTLAENAGHLAQSTSVPGVAQRTGATVYYLEMYPRSDGPAPVMALMPVPGDVDVVVAGELMEAGRAVLRGFVTPDRTTLVVSTHRDYALSEKMAMGDGRTSAEKVLDSAREASSKLIGFDMAALADDTGSVISSVLFGALAGSGALPFDREQYEKVIRDSGKAVEANLAGFAAGFDRAFDAKGESSDSWRAAVPGGHPPETGNAPRREVHPQVARILQRLRDEFPELTHEVLTHGIRRLIDYQDPRYAHEYLDRLAPILQAEPAGRKYQLTIDTGRHLALWMSYEDTIRVAEIKTRAARFERFRSEVRAAPGQIVNVTEFMHPRIEEICDTLPAPLGRLVLKTAFLRKCVGLFCRKGRKIPTSKLSGFLLLYSVSALKSWRRSTLRYQVETPKIRHWLDLIRETAAHDYDLALEIAACQRLIKGYGDTHERGTRNFNAIMERLEQIRRAPDPAVTLRELRDAALADEFGDALRENLKKVA